ncbi:hypothetical protein L7F22_056214 [Adiantum nelumboides]|nr:hypothetical protein [Adiantum nelumboides]
MVWKEQLRGHVVSRNGIEMAADKITSIQQAKPPKNVSELSSFLGYIKLFRRFIHMFATKAIVLYILTQKDVKFIWTLECQESFQALKDAVSSKPILRQPNWEVIFHVHVDALGVAMGAILVQPDGKDDYPVYFVSRRFSKAEQGYSTTEREALGIGFSATKFRHYLLGKLFYFYVDHQALLYLINKVVIQGRLIRWMMFLMEFEFKIFHKLGKSHCEANYLSGNTEGNKLESLRDEPVDATLFHTTAATVEELDQEWMEVQEFLQSGKIREDWPHSRKKGLTVKCLKFTIISGSLYRLGIDGVLRRSYCKTYDICQRMRRPTAADLTPLTIIQPLKVFMKWGIDFMGPFKSVEDYLWVALSFGADMDFLAFSFRLVHCTCFPFHPERSVFNKCVVACGVTMVMEVDNIDDFVEVGLIRSTHGVKGELKVMSLTDFPEQRFERPGIRWVGFYRMGKLVGQRKIELLCGRKIMQGKDHAWLLTFEGVDSKEKASELVGATILVENADRPVLNADQFYIPELIGMSVQMKDSGNVIGSIVDIFNSGASDLLRVKLSDSEDNQGGNKEVKDSLVWIPFVKEIVPIVDKENRFVEITPPQGLLELNAPSKRPLKQELRKQAYDRVDWGFLEGSLIRIGFLQDWIRGVSALYRSTLSSVTIGGHDGRRFDLSRSVRQGCPLAPYLFLFVAEAISDFIRVHQQALRGLLMPVSDEPDLIDQEYADDTLLFLHYTPDVLDMIRYALEMFCVASGARINWDKSYGILAGRVGCFTRAAVLFHHASYEEKAVLLVD